MRLERIVFSISGNKNHLVHNLAWIILDFRKSKTREEKKKHFGVTTPGHLKIQSVRGRKTFTDLFSNDINKPVARRPGGKEEEELGSLNRHSWK